MSANLNPLPGKAGTRCGTCARLSYRFRQWPLRNGGNETLVYLVFFLFLAVCGAGAFSLDSLRARREVKRSAFDTAVTGA